MSFKILSINPGSTSTKIALYEDEHEIFCQTIRHTDSELMSNKTIAQQYEFRKDVVLSFLKEKNVDISELSAVVGRGGQLPNVKSGGYIVNDKMIHTLLDSNLRFHASNMGALIADAIARPLKIPAYIYDCVGADELCSIAKITGFPEIIRQSFCHVLNSKAISRKVAEKFGRKYEDMNFIVAHIGGGISVSAHEKGRIIDVITDDAGPFSPERSGSIPIMYVVEMCFSNKFSKDDVVRKIHGGGGIKAHLGTSNCEEVERRINAGDQNAKRIYEAEAYQIAKGIGEMAPPLCGKVDAVILTGGVAYSKMLTDWITQRVKYLGPVIVMPGENEMEALTLGTLRILKGEESAAVYGEE